MVKKLEGKEIQQSRQLWEEIFTEDTKEFLDYYYDTKVRENRILGGFQEEKLVSMLHLNPYRLYMGQREISSEYIVAVATKEAYRHQGRMAELLHQAMLEAGKEGTPFVFLMPAKESIYEPFDFVTVYQRKDYCFTKQMLSEALENSRSIKKESSSVYIEEIAEVIPEKLKSVEIRELIKYSQSRLQKHYQVFAKRDQQYYECLLKEQISQQGSILLARDGDTKKICGYCFMANEGEVQLRELVCDEYREAQILSTIWEKYKIKKELKLWGGEFADHSLVANSIFPCIMVRVTEVCRFIELIPLLPKEKQWVESHPVIGIVDTFLEENHGQYLLKLENRGEVFYAKAEKQKDSLKKTEESLQSIPAFAIEEIIRKSFQKLKIFLNEVV